MDHKTDTDSAADALIRKLRDILDESRSYIGAPTFSPSMDSEAAVAVDLADQYLNGRASLAASAGIACQCCGGSGEDPEGFYDQSRGDAGHTHDGPCRSCGGSGVAASAGSWPVAWFVEEHSDIQDLEWNRIKPTYPGNWKPLYTQPSPPEGAGWQPITEAPQNGRALLLGYFNSAGKWRTTRGQWMSQDYIYEYAEDPDCMSPGWHETTVEDDDGKCWPIDPTHFMPLPAPPASEAKEASQ